MSHRAKVYWSKEQLLKERTNGKKSKLFLSIMWKRHVERNGNTPLIIKCAICSGKERIRDIKNGNFKVSTRLSKQQKEEELD